MTEERRALVDMGATLLVCLLSVSFLLRLKLRELLLVVPEGARECREQTDRRSGRKGSV